LALKDLSVSKVFLSFLNHMTNGQISFEYHMAFIVIKTYLAFLSSPAKLLYGLWK
jgi:hypothetical protein